MKIPESELLLNDDHSVYHLNLLPDDISDTIILVGDKDRVPLISSLFDKIEIKKNKREFYTHTGFYKQKRITVISTGIGTDNIDIVLNELDALANIDLHSREIKPNPTSLKLIRIGTCGTVQREIPVNSHILSTHGLGLDNLLRYYQCRWTAEEKFFYDEIKKHLQYHLAYTPFYLFEASSSLMDVFSSHDFYRGITITSPGFFGPQCRSLRLPLAYPNLIDALSTFTLNNRRILNFEMETSAIYGLSKLMGHQALTIDLVLANRILQTASINYHDHMLNLARKVLDIIAGSDL